MSEPLVYSLIFGAVLLLVAAVYLGFSGRSISRDARVNRRLERLGRAEGREEALDQLRKEMSQYMNARRMPLYGLLASRAQKADVALGPAQLLLVMVALAGAAFTGLTLGTSADLPVRVALAAAVGIGGVFAWVNGRAKRRLALIEEQLPDAVELMVRSLRVGHPFSSAIGIVAREVVDPLGSEMGKIADEAAYGRDVGEALMAMAERLGMQDLRFLAVAVTIQQSSGGNLAEILDGLARVIRSRFKLFRRVRAITVEARWSGQFLSGFPLAALVGINLMAPDYYGAVRQTGYFLPACLAVAGFLIANVLVMRALVNIKV